MLDPSPHAPTPAMHGLDLRLETPDGALRARVGVPAGPMRLAELAFNAMGLDEKLVELAVKRERAAGRAITCRAGCGACCRQLVPLSPPEAWMLADVIAAMPPPRRQVVLERFAAAARRLEAEGFRPRMERRAETDQETRELAWDYFRLGMPCPFLEQEACSIHPLRPSACREYLVTSPAEHCADPFRGPVRRIGVSVNLSKALARLTAELLGGEPQLIPLTLAPAWAAEHEAEGRREWDGPTLLKRLLALMSER